MFLLFVAVNHKINSAIDGDFSGTGIPYNCGSCLYFHFVISCFKHARKQASILSLRVTFVVNLFSSCRFHIDKLTLCSS